MSKTVRRKKVNNHTILNEICMDWGNGCIGKVIQCARNCPYKDNKKTISRYRRDTHVGYGLMGHAPKNINKMFNRSKRAKMKAEVKRIMVQGDYEEYTFNKWVRDAGWYYW